MTSADVVLQLRTVHREEIGSIPGARCGTDNIASRLTLQKVGFVPYAHMLHGAIR